MNGGDDPLPVARGNAVLRRLAAPDLRAFQAYRSDPDLGRYQGWSAMSDAQALAFLNQMSVAALLQPGVWLQLGIVEAHNESGLIGDIGLCLAADGLSAEVGFTLARHAQGRGLARDAVRAAVGLVFALTAARSVRGTTDARNTASVRLLERIGMRRIAVAHAVFRGAPCVEWTYAIEPEGS